MYGCVSIHFLFGLIGLCAASTKYDWTWRSDLQPPQRVISASAQPVDNTLYLIGGEGLAGTDLTGNQMVSSFDPTGTSWSAVTYANDGTSPCPWTANSMHTSISYQTDNDGSRVMTVGGRSNVMCYFTGTTWINSGYNLHTEALRYMASCAHTDGILFSGGVTAGGTVTALYVYMQYNSPWGWTVHTPALPWITPYKRYQHGMVVGSAGKIYTVFGSRDGSTCENKLYYKNSEPDTATGFILGPVYNYGNSKGKCGAAITFVNGYIIILGGSETVNGTPDNEMIMYDSGNEVWVDPTDSGALNDNIDIPRTFAALGQVAGRLMVIGGKATSSIALKDVEYIDQQAILGRCYEETLWDSTGGATQIDDGFLELPIRTFGFTFEATLNVQGCSDLCKILTKSDCSNNNGGFIFAIYQDQWAIHLGRTKGYVTWGGLPAVSTGQYSVQLELESPDTWRLSVKDLSTQVSSIDTISGSGVGDTEIPMHTLQLGGTIGCSGTFVGGMSNIEVGACTGSKLVTTVPGYGAYLVTPDDALSFTLTDPGGLGPNLALVTPVYLTITGSDSTVQKIGSDVLQTLLDNGKMVATIGTDPFLDAATVTYTIYNTAHASSADVTYTLQMDTEYTIVIDSTWLKYSGGTFTGIGANTWKFRTKHQDYRKETFEECDSVTMLLNVEPAAFNETAWCSAMTRAFSNVPCRQLPIQQRRGHGDHTIEIHFRVTAVVATCDELHDRVSILLTTGTLNTYLLYYGLGSPPRGTYHWGSYIRKTASSEMIYRKPFEVYNSPDACNGPTDITMDIQYDAKHSTSGYILPANGIMSVVFPYDFVLTAGSMELSYCAVPCITPVTGISGSLISNEVTFENIGNGAAVGSMTITVTGATMPSSCESVNSWVWVVKTYDSSSHLHAWISKFGHRDSCHGVTAIVFGDPHFQSFSGGSYDVNGKANFFYNVISDKYFMWNSRFVSLNPRGHGTMHTFLGESAFIINGTHIYCDPVAWRMYIGGDEVKQMDERIRLFGDSSIYYVKITEHIMYVRAPGFFVALKHVLKEHGKALPHFDHVVTLSDEPGGRHHPHGLLGQTASFKKPVKAKGHQGEGVIEGTVADYEVATLWSTKFQFNQYNPEGKEVDKQGGAQMRVVH